ncbi:MAG: methyltransferase domain-containing protein [Thermoanaerobaculia bacterium]
MPDGMLTAIVAGECDAAAEEKIDALSAFFRRSGFLHEFLVMGTRDEDARVAAVRRIELGEGGIAAALRRAVSESRGDVVAILEPEALGCMEEIGHAIALIQTDTTDIVHASTNAASESGERLASMVLLCDVASARSPVRVYSMHAARVLFAESKLGARTQPFELLYLANRFGFRITRIPLRTGGDAATRRQPGARLRELIQIRRLDKAGAYRAPRRCPVCFSADVRSAAQIPGHVVRACDRCKCRYLASLPSEEEIESAWNPARPEPAPPATTRRTYEKQARSIRRLVRPGGRILEVGAGAGMFGAMLGQEFDYVGIDLADANARHARASGVQVYRCPLSRYVNVGSPFDAVVLFRVFEFLPDPHDALARIRELLKPGGYLLMVTPDTESLSGTLSTSRWLQEKFPDHLILYSRSALIEILERSGFEITSAGAFVEYREHERLEAGVSRFGKAAQWAVKVPLAILPNPLPLSDGAIRVVARRRAGPAVTPQGIRSVEATHAR